jgi:hypothetical protein
MRVGKKLIMDISALFIFAFSNRRLDEEDVKIA